MTASRSVVIVEGLRTPIGRARKGSLVDIRPDDLAGAVVRRLVENSLGGDWSAISEVVTGCAYPWGEQGFNVSRSITLLAGAPPTIPAHTVSRHCASSLQAIRSAHHSIAMGEADAVIAVGVESVSRVGRDRHLADSNPLLDPAADGQTIANAYIPMVDTAEIVAKRTGTSRADMDAFAANSQFKAAEAERTGLLAWRRSPVWDKGAVILDRDESIRPQTTVATLAGLEPVFAEGSVTPGNACPLNDGAAATLLMTEDRARALGLRTYSRILSHAVTALEPELMGLGPVNAVKSAISQAGLQISDIDAIEFNEAFAAQVIPACRKLGIDPEDPSFNAHGGAIALGHPFGMTGVRMAITLRNVLEDLDGEIGLQTMCVGGGQGQAMVIQRC